MLKDRFSGPLVAATPLLLVILLVTVYDSALRNYIKCERGDCESITNNLNHVLLPDDPTTREPAPGDSKEEQRKKEIKGHERNAARYGGRVTWLFLRLA